MTLSLQKGLIVNNKIISRRVLVGWKWEITKQFGINQKCYE